MREIGRAGVVIPVYGEESSVCSILSRFRVGTVSTICLVVDSPLRLAMGRIRDAARESEITVHIIKNKRRTGVGFSIRQGLQYLLNTGHEVVVIMAGNGKDNPAEIDRILDPVLRREYDYVQGSRYLPGGKSIGMPLLRAIFSRLYPLIWTVLTGRRCTDVTNGFRCYRLDLLRDHRISLDQNWLNGYSLEYYLHYKILVLGYRMKEVAVSKTYPFRSKGGYSKIQPLKDWWPIISPLMLLFFGARR